MGFYVKAPFSDEQLRSINTYQRDGRFSALMCDCGGKLYGRHDGMVCPSCFVVIDRSPRWVTNWMWNRFSGKMDNVEEIVDGISECGNVGG